MTIKELSQTYKIDINKLKVLEDYNLIDLDNVNDTGINKISVMCSLYDMGMKAEDIKKLVDYDYNKDKIAQINLLNSVRSQLLDKIHQNQKYLDNIDYIIYKIKNKEQSIF